MNDGLFFVALKNQTNLRRDILLSSKSLIDSLRAYENYTAVKEQKMEQVLELKRIFDELMVLNKKLRAKFPVVPMKAEPSEKQIQQKQSKQQKATPQKEAVKKVAKSKLEILEAELEAIEQRLGRLE